MSFIHFTDWLKKEPIILDEAKGETYKDAVNLSASIIKSKPEIFTEFCSIFGITSIPMENTIKKLTKDEYKGFFRKKEDANLEINEPIRDKYLSGELKLAIKTELKLDDRFLAVFLPQNNIWVKIKGSSSGAYNAKGHVYIPKENTPLQECLTAVILEKLAQNKTSELIAPKNGYVPPSKTDKRGKVRLYAPMTPEYQYWHWIVSSDPAKNTGICKYYKLDAIPTSEQDYIDLKDELINFADKWGKTFYTLAKSNIINTMKSIWIKPKQTNWSKAKFYHYARIDETCKGIYEYLKNYRCGKDKDTVDKSDIVLGWDKKVVEKHIDWAIKVKDVDEHNTMLNHWMNTQELVGISLKKITGAGPEVSAVNLFKEDVETNATGENINNKYKVAVYYGKKNTDCTFNSKIYTKYTDDPTKTQFLGFMVNRGHKRPISVDDPSTNDIHGDAVELRIGKAGDNVANVEFYMTIPKQAAAMGKAGEAFKALDKTPIPEPEYYINRKGERVPRKMPKIKNAFSITDKYYENEHDYIALAEWIKSILEGNAENIAKVFGYATGYPVIEIVNNHQKVAMSAAPYIKIS